MQQLAVIGLSTMGANLARNAARNGATVTVYNRTTEKAEQFMALHGNEGKFVLATTLPEVVQSMKAPRAVLVMVKADGVDAVIEELAPLLSKGDVIVDGGNSHYRETKRREKKVAAKGLKYVGMGVSGGEEGALNGPSMMPGGDKTAIEPLMPLLQKMSARDGAGGSCVAYMGPDGAGHFVKMVHNGIEYAVMQLLAEAYHLLGSVGKMNNDQMADLFATWNAEGNLSSFLTEITVTALRKKDADTGEYLLDVIKDISGQKGTGKWTVEAGFDYAVSVPSITAAVDARIVSGGKDFRVQQAKRDQLHGDDSYRLENFVDAVKVALECSVINAYAQGFQLLSAASVEERWNLDLSEICRIWRGGCIIRSALLPQYQAIFAGDMAAAENLRARFGRDEQLQWRHVVALGPLHAIPLPAMSASLSYYDAYRTDRLPQNLIAAQRDLFGAHTFERLDKEGSFHVDWSA
jgi:6-phosphogluconate dehydrogenase